MVIRPLLTLLPFLHFTFGAVVSRSANVAPGPVSVYFTSDSLSPYALSQQPNLNWGNTNQGDINLNFDGTTHQTIDGFGASLTESSSYLLSTLDANTRNNVMTMLFDQTNGIGLNFLRQPIGGSDLDLPYDFYTFDDSNSPDTDLSSFSTAHDSQYIIPMLQQAKAINPDIYVMGTPWSPPAWMKSGNNLNGSTGGTLQSQYYTQYAQYFVDFVKSYSGQGINIDFVSAQNEPLYAPNGYPGMSFPATASGNFINSALGPAFANNGITTKILAYDHNWDQPDYPQTVLSEASNYVYGVAWHCYAGDPISAQRALQSSNNNIPQYLTECSGGSWETDPFSSFVHQGIQILRNYGKSLVRWGLVMDENGNPNLSTGAACSGCRGVAIVPSDGSAPQYSVDYYALGQFSKFVSRGATVLGGSDGGSIANVAFANTDGSTVVVMYNNQSSSVNYGINYNGFGTAITVPANTAATFKWNPAGANSPTPAGIPQNGPINQTLGTPSLDSAHPPGTGTPRI